MHDQHRSQDQRVAFVVRAGQRWTGYRTTTLPSGVSKMSPRRRSIRAYCGEQQKRISGRQIVETETFRTRSRASSPTYEITTIWFRVPSTPPTTSHGGLEIADHASAVSNMSPRLFPFRRVTRPSVIEEDVMLRSIPIHHNRQSHRSPSCPPAREFRTPSRTSRATPHVDAEFHREVARCHVCSRRGGTVNARAGLC